MLELKDHACVTGYCGHSHAGFCMMAISRFAESDDCPRVHPTGAVVLTAEELEAIEQCCPRTFELREALRNLLARATPEQPTE